MGNGWVSIIPRYLYLQHCNLPITMCFYADQPCGIFKNRYGFFTLYFFFLRTSVHSIRKEKEIYRRWFTYSIKKENSPLLPVSWSLLLSFYQVLSSVLIKTIGNTLWAVKQKEALQETAAVPGASCSFPERLALYQILAAASHNLSIALLHHCKKSAPMQDTTSKPMVFLESIYTHLCPGA